MLVGIHTASLISGKRYPIILLNNQEAIVKKVDNRGTKNTTDTSLLNCKKPQHSWGKNSAKIFTNLSDKIISRAISFHRPCPEESKDRCLDFIGTKPAKGK